DAADAAGLVAVLEEEVVVAIALHLRMVGDGAVLVAHALPYPVEVDHVFLEWVVRGQVGAAAEPRLRPVGEVTEVGMHSGHDRAARVDDERDAGGGEADAVAGQRLGKVRREVAEHLGEVDAALLDHCSIGDDAGASAAAARPLPGVFAELRTAVGGLHSGTNAILEAAQVVRGSGM